MQVAIVLGEKEIEIAVGKMKKKSEVKKILTVNMRDKLYQNGEILDALTLGKEILIHLKEIKVVPTEVVFAIRSNDIVITEVSIPVIGEKLILQTIKVALEEKFPGVAEKNYLAYQIWDMEQGNFSVVAAIAPKSLVESYYSLAKAMKCRLRKIDLYASCIARAVSMDATPKGIGNHLFIDACNDFIQFYYISDGVVLLSNSFTFQRSLSVKKESARVELLEKLWQGTQTVMSVIEEDKVDHVYLNNRNCLSEHEVSEFGKEIQGKSQMELLLWNEGGVRTELLLKSLLQNTKGLRREMNFALEMNLDDLHNFKNSDLVASIIAGLSITVVMTIGGAIGYTVYQTKVLDQIIIEEQAFIDANKEIDIMYENMIAREAEVDYQRKMDLFFDTTKYDYLEIQEQLNEALAQGNAVMSSMSIDHSLYLLISGNAPDAKDVASILTKLKEQGFEEVQLQSILPTSNDAEGQTQRSYDFMVRLRYKIQEVLEDSQEETEL